MKRVLICLITIACVAGAFADQLIMNKIVKEGALQGFDKGKFRFLTEKGKFLKEQASRVSTIVLKSPKKATFLGSSSKKPEQAVLKGFDKQKFTFEKEGKELVIPLSKIKKLDVMQETESKSGSGNGDDGGYPIPPVNLEAFAGDNLTDAQQKALDKFKDTKKVFDDFLNVSVGMVREMDQAKGEKREQLLNQLRKRKLEEQPLRKSLVSAYDALVDAFPEEPEQGAQ